MKHQLAYDFYNFPVAVIKIQKGINTVKLKIPGISQFSMSNLQFNIISLLESTVDSR